MAKADGSVIIDTRINTSGFQTGAANIKKGFDGIGSALGKLSKIMIGVFAIRQVVQFGKKTIELGSDLSEVQNVVDVTFGKLNSEINEFSKNAIKQFGLSETSAKQFSSTMGAMLKSMGFTTREAADMGMTIAGLAGDIASFYNLDVSEAFAKIRSGISGETEPLKQLGINLNVANLEQYALTQGIQKSYNAMTQQEQALLRYNYLLSVTSDAQGDFARTSGGWANQTRILSEQFNSIKATLGQGFINLFTPILKQLNQLIVYLQKASDAFLHFTQILTGTKNQQVSEGILTTAEAYDEVSKSIEDAEAAQNGYLSGLDEINKFSNDSNAPETGISTNTPNVSASVDFSESTNIFDEIADKLKNIVKQANKLSKLFKKGFSTGLGYSIEKLKDIQEDLQKIGQAFGDISLDSNIQEAASGFIKSLATAIGTQLVAISGIGLTIASSIFGGIRGYFDENSEEISGRTAQLFNIGTKITDLTAQLSADLEEVFTNVFEGETAEKLSANIFGIFSEAFGGISVFVSETTLSIVQEIKKIFDDNKEDLSKSARGTLEGLEEVTSSIKESVLYIARTVLPDLGSAFEKTLEIFSPFTDFISETFVSVWQDILNPLIEDFSKIISDAGEDLKKFWEDVCVPLGDFLGEVLAPAVEFLSFVFRQLWENVIVPLADFLREVFLAAWEAIIAYVQNVARPKFENLISVLKKLWDNVLSPIVDFLIKNLKPAVVATYKSIKQVIDGAKKILTGILEFLTGVFSGDWEKAWNSIKKIFTGIMDTLVGIVKVPLNEIIGYWNTLLSACQEAMNFLIDGLNKFSIDIPSWVPKIGGKTFGFNIPNIDVNPIPYLATGAVIPPNAPFMAMLGDQRHGNNLEMPENLLRKIVREETGGQSINGNIELKVYLSGQQIYQEVMRIADIVRAKSGRSPYEVV